jgi:hypothetical protein
MSLNIIFIQHNEPYPAEAQVAELSRAHVLTAEQCRTQDSKERLRAHL